MQLAMGASLSIDKADLMLPLGTVLHTMVMFLSVLPPPKRNRSGFSDNMACFLTQSPRHILIAFSFSNFDAQQQEKKEYANCNVQLKLISSCEACSGIELIRTKLLIENMN